MAMAASPSIDAVATCVTHTGFSRFEFVRFDHRLLRGDADDENDGHGCRHAAIHKSLFRFLLHWISPCLGCLIGKTSPTGRFLGVHFCVDFQ
jgi:hypothetical protein